MSQAGDEGTQQQMGQTPSKINQCKYVLINRATK